MATDGTCGFIEVPAFDRDWRWEDIAVRLGRTDASCWWQGRRLDEAWFLSRVTHYDLWFVWDGLGYLKPVNGDLIRLQPGICLWMRQGQYRAAWQDEGSQLKIRFFHFQLLRPDGTDLEPAQLHEMPSYLESLNLSHFDGITQSIVDLSRYEYPISPWLSSQITQAAHVLFKGLLMQYEVFARIQQAEASQGIERKQSRMIWDIVLQIHQGTRPLTHLDAVIASTGYTADHFRRLFKAATGMTPHAMLILARIDRAKSLLTSTHTPLEWIARDVGYANRFYFSRQFKEYVGMSPSEFRRRHT